MMEYGVTACIDNKGIVHGLKEKSVLKNLFEANITNSSFLTIVMILFFKGPNILSENLLWFLNDSGELHMIPASLNGTYIIRCLPSSVTIDR